MDTFTMNRVDGATKRRTESVKWIVAPQGGANEGGIDRTLMTCRASGANKSFERYPQQDRPEE